jgi:FAD:protein FMN transferase
MDCTDEVGRAQFKALGTGAVVLTTGAAEIARAAAEVRAEVDAIDEACSRFRADSELEVANRASGHRVAVGPILADAIDTALRAAELTEGDVDPTVGEALRVIGYDTDFDSVTRDGRSVVRFVPARGWRSVSFDRRNVLLQMPAGIRLDLGATAKALAADRAARRAAAATGCGVLVSLGGDIATSGPHPASGWLVRVTEWHGSPLDAPGQTVRLDSGGLATSSTAVRAWTRGGDRVHHIVDPRSGRPVEPIWTTVTVAAGTCVDANVAATAAIVRGERGPAWLQSLGLPARLVRQQGTVVAVGGWPAEGRAA